MKIIIYSLLLISFTSSAAIEDYKIYPIYETEAVKTSGDAADDPAFWLNKTNPEKSIVLGTDKKSGIYTYDLSGKTLNKNKACLIVLSAVIYRVVKNNKKRKGNIK